MATDIKLYPSTSSNQVAFLRRKVKILDDRAQDHTLSLYAEWEAILIFIVQTSAVVNGTEVTTAVLLRAAADAIDP